MTLIRFIAILAAMTVSASSFAQTELLTELLGGSRGGSASVSSGVSGTASAAASGAASMLMRGSSSTGVIAGLNFSDDPESQMNQYHVGVVTRMNLALGFSLQPGILYNVKGSTIKGAVKGADLSTSVGYLEVPVQLQWGIRIKKFRPFIFGEPFVGYAVNAKNVLNYQNTLQEIAGEVLADQGKIEEIKGDMTNRLEYGVGVGAGLQYGIVQLNAKLFRNIGNLYNENGEMEDIKQTLTDAVKDAKSMSGFSVSLVVLF